MDGEQFLVNLAEGSQERYRAVGGGLCVIRLPWLWYHDGDSRLPSSRDETCEGDASKKKRDVGFYLVADEYPDPVLDAVATWGFLRGGVINDISYVLTCNCGEKRRCHLLRWSLRVIKWKRQVVGVV